MYLDAQGKELIPFAYNILGSFQDAKDVVQEVMLERLLNKNTAIENDRAYLVRSVINRAINLKTRQKKIISHYPGNWLPEPVVTEGADHDLEQRDILSYSLMILMEKLDARSRAVFILKEAFSYDHEEIASVLHISPQNSRKILSRAKKQLGDERPPRASEVPSDYLTQYVDIIRKGDIQRLEALLHADIITTSDGGGKAVAALKPVTGKKSVLLFLLGIYQKFYSHAAIKAGEINHQPAIFYFENDTIVTCQIMELEGALIKRIYFMRNPDKLAVTQNALMKDSHLSSGSCSFQAAS